MMTWARPKKRDWKRGATQVGLFYRGPNGHTLEITVDECDDDEKRALERLILAVTKKETM